MARNVELLQACVAQEGQRTYPTPEEAPGILLVDFRKAYDTLNRPYLLRAMEALSFAPAFIQLVDRMHQNTTARFLVNGSTSRPIPVTRGIRQGCPLAPLLFPIAAEGLRHMVADHRTIRGITLHAGSHSSEHRIATFLDDTAIMVQKGDMLHAVADVLREFGANGGVEAQPTKIFLGLRDLPDSWEGFPVLRHTDTVRYLGVEIGNTTPRSITGR